MFGWQPDVMPTIASGSVLAASGYSERSTQLMHSSVISDLEMNNDQP